MLVPELAPQKKIIVGEGIFFHTFIKDNTNCNSHGKDIYLSLAEYSYYTGDYDKDTKTFRGPLGPAILDSDFDITDFSNSSQLGSGNEVVVRGPKRNRPKF